MSATPLETVDLEVKYEAGHSYKERWVVIDYYCPKCGNRDVWHVDGEGDYYIGETFLCLSCEAHFYLPRDPQPQVNNWQDAQRLSAIKKALGRT